MRRARYSLLALLLIAGLPTLSTAQPVGFSIGENPVEADASWIMAYDFEQGESVTYRVASLDSIVIWQTTPQILLRQRVERITYRCDTILPDGFGMTMTLDDVVVRERFDTLPWITRTEHPWSGTSIRFVMDRQGKRLRLRDTLDQPGVLPGAPFQPLILPHLGNGDTLQAGAGTVFDREMWLLENAYPPVLWKGGVLRKMMGGTDTLGRAVGSVQLNETGQLWFMPPAPPGRESISMHSVLNGTGTYLIDFEAGYPVVGDYQMIANLTLTDGDEENQRFGRQVISMIFHIDDLSEDLETFLEREALQK